MNDRACGCQLAEVGGGRRGAEPPGGMEIGCLYPLRLNKL